MAYLDENATWEQGIYQWETQDPVVGGPDGIDNVPTRQLANRTGYLKEQIAAHAAATDPHPQYTTESEVHALVEVTQAQFDASKKVATTEFVQRALGNCQGVLQVTVPGTTTLTAANVGQFIDIYAAGNVVIGLPQSSQCAPGSALLLTNYGSQAATVNPYAGDSINNTAALGSVSIAVNGTGLFINQGGGMWRLAGGDALLPSSGVMSGANWVTPAQFDNSTRLATTSFVQRALGNLSDAVAVTTSSALSSKDAGKIVLFGGSESQTLSMPSGVRAGTSYYLYNWSPAPWTLTTASGVFNGPGATGTNSLVIPAGTFACVVFDSTNWVAIYSPYAALPSQFDASNRQATTGFVQQALGNQAGAVSYTSAATMVKTDWGKLTTLGATSAFTLTLPSVSGVNLGSSIMFSNYGTATVTISPPSGFTGAFLTPGGNTQTYAIPANGRAKLVWDGANFVCFDNRWGMTTAQFDNSPLLATTAFVQRALGNYSAGRVVSGTVALTPDLAGSAYTSNGGTITLPAFSSVLNGTSFMIQAAAQTTINLAGSDTLWYAGQHSARTLTLNTGDWVIITAIGEWEVVAGSVLSGTAAQFDSSSRNATTAFVQRALGNRQTVFGVQTSQTLPASIMGGYVVLNGGTSSLTVTLPSAGLVPGAEILVGNSTAYDSVFSTGTSAAFYGAGIPWLTTYTIRSGMFCVMTWDGGNWLVTASDTSTNPATTDNSNRIATTSWVRSAIANIVNGSFLSSLAAAAGFAFSAGANGYLKLPSWLGGLMLQWGRFYAQDDSYNALTFPVAFPNACLSVSASIEANGPLAGATSGSCVIGKLSATGCYIGSSVYNDPGAVITGYVYWIAVGY